MDTRTPQRRTFSRLTVFGAITVWFGVVGGGFAVVWVYAITPGSPSPMAANWPVDTTISRTPHRANLIMFAHPRCPCTRASLAELAEIVRRHSAVLQTRVLFFEPDQAPDEWRDTENWHFAKSLARVEAFPDPGGCEARRFGGKTSGQVLLYDESGRLIFSGGITPLRGERGDNPGRRAILAWRMRQPVECSTCNVFGCPLAAEQ